MSILPAAEVTAMRAVADTALPGTAVVMRHSHVSDGQGGRTDSYAASGTVDARLAAVTGGAAETLVGDRVAEAAAFVLTVPVGTAIGSGDRVVYDGVTYEVDELHPFGSPWDISSRVRLRLVD